MSHVSAKTIHTIRRLRKNLGRTPEALAGQFGLPVERVQAYLKLKTVPSYRALGDGYKVSHAEVKKRLQAGQRGAEIARELGVAADTVHQIIYRKFPEFLPWKEPRPRVPGNKASVFDHDEVLKLVALELYTYEAIAEHYGVTPGAISKLVQRKAPWLKSPDHRRRKS